MGRTLCCAFVSSHARVCVCVFVSVCLCWALCSSPAVFVSAFFCVTEGHLISSFGCWVLLGLYWLTVRWLCWLLPLVLLLFCYCLFCFVLFCFFFFFSSFLLSFTRCACQHSPPLLHQHQIHKKKYTLVTFSRTCTDDQSRRERRERRGGGGGERRRRKEGGVDQLWRCCL